MLAREDQTEHFRPMAIYLHWLLPNSRWVLAAIGRGKIVETFLATEEGHQRAEEFIARHRGAEIRVLAGNARTILSDVPSMEHFTDICAIGIRAPLALKDAIMGLQNKPAIAFEHRGYWRDGRLTDHFIAAWRFDRFIPTKDADKAEQFLAERFKGSERLNFFIPVPIGRAVLAFERRYVDPKNIEAALKSGPVPVRHDNPAVKRQAETLMETLADYGFEGEIKSIRSGPVISLYEIELRRGTLASSIAARAEDIARDMGSTSARIITNLGPRTIGIELPNAKREKVLLRDLVTVPAFQKSDAALPLILGKDAAGAPLVVDLAAMPHLLLAGTTGSGKSVELNVMILSLLHRFSPAECKLVLIDPKVVELSIYKDIPNLLCRVVTETKKAIATLKGMVEEMNARYVELERLGARNIQSYNAKSTDKLPYIVVVIDEVADLMMDKEEGKEIESSIQRLAQKARAAGIHLIVATQRPSVDAIKGTIKSNLPARISLLMASAIDSRTIIGENGAEQLLGNGDMLYQTTGGKLVRAHGAYVSEDEVEDAVKALKRLGKPDYRDFDVEEDETETTPRRGKRVSDARERVRHQFDLMRGEWSRTDLIRRVRMATGASETVIKEELKIHPRIRRQRVSDNVTVPSKITIE